MRLKWFFVACTFVVVCALAFSNTRTAQAEDALLLHTSGVHKLLADERDRGLINALEYVNPRLMELPGELDRHDIPAPIIALVFETLQNPMTLRLNVDEGAMQRGETPVNAQLVIHDDERGTLQQRAMQLMQTVRMFAPMPIEPMDEFPTLNRMESPDGDVVFGLWEEPDQPLRFVMSFNLDDPRPRVDLPVTELPAGVEPAGIMRMDMPKFEPLMDMLMMFAGPDAEQTRQEMEDAGLLGPDAMTLDVAVGHGVDRAHLAARARRLAALHREQGLLAERAITRDDLRIVPADAGYASVTRSRLQGAGEQIQEMIEQAEMFADEPFFSNFLEQANVDLIDDVFAHLGELSAAYTSTRTGGGGMFSLVALAETTNGDALSASLSRLEQTLNAPMAEELRGYVRFDRDAVNDMTLTTLRFPGMPIPLEVCYGITDGFLVAGMSTAAVQAAVDQVRNPERSLLHHTGFIAMGGDRIDGAIDVTFVDSPRLAASGYGMTNALMSACRNALHSPQDVDRRVPPIMPGYTELNADAKPMLLITRVHGDDYVMHSEYDRSLLFNTSAMVGAFSGTGIMLPALTMGLTLPALHQARERAKEMRSLAQLRGIGMTLSVYGTEHNDRLPPDLDALIDEGYMTEDLLRSPYGPVWDDNGDYWLDSRYERRSESRVPHMDILAYDRAMYSNHHRVGVLYYDGHVDTLNKWEFLERLEDESNAGVEFNLPEW